MAGSKASLAAYRVKANGMVEEYTWLANL
jgi:hypothetical protein